MLAQRNAALHGVVRDAQGTPQMGVAVQVLSPDARVAASAFTDLNGRYLIRDLVPGLYQLRATATLSLPAMRSKLLLRAGEMPTVNVVLSGLLDGTFLPMTQRHSEDQPDDWRWTLRSSANRPLLRVFADDAGSGSPERSTARPQIRRTVSVGQNDGGFGAGGTHFSAQQRRIGAGDRPSVIIARVGVLHLDDGAAAMDLAAVFEGQSTPIFSRRVAVHVETLPQISLGGRPAAAFAVMDTAMAEQFAMGEFAKVEAGTMLRAIHSGQTAIVSYPFLRIETRAPGGWVAGYALATNAQMQQMSDVGRAVESIATTGIVAGRLQTERGLHQSVYVRRRVGKGTLKATIEHDALRTVSIAGAGLGSPAMESAAGDAVAGLMIDRSNGTFRALHSGYDSDGMSVLISYPLAPSANFDAEYTDGTGLATSRSHATTGRPLTCQQSQSVRVGVETKMARTGTRISARYAWQPKTVATMISPFSAEDGTYLSVHLKQRLRAGRLLPPDTQLSLDGRNLMAQGYMVLASAETAPSAIVASTVRSLQASLSFSF